jgi:hypothetical protein
MWMLYRLHRPPIQSCHDATDQIYYLKPGLGPRLRRLDHEIVSRPLQDLISVLPRCSVQTSWFRKLTSQISSLSRPFRSQFFSNVISGDRLILSQPSQAKPKCLQLLHAVCKTLLSVLHGCDMIADFHGLSSVVTANVSPRS